MSFFKAIYSLFTNYFFPCILLLLTSAPIVGTQNREFVIVSTNDPVQASYWQDVLEAKNNDTRHFLVVYEDWPGSADNGLGTLYAFQKANAHAQLHYDSNLLDILNEGGSVSIFHCAGMGKRLYPLTASENNNKSAVKVPGNGSTQSILDLVLSHSLSFTPFLKGRLSVFWGDQIFIPTVSLQEPNEHVNIFAMAGDFPTETDWKKKRLDQYGLILIDENSPQLIEKTTYSNLLSLVSKISPEQPLPIGISLGSFSISAQFLRELLIAFQHELSIKQGKFNTDYHFWMPLTWSKEQYIDFMLGKGESFSEIVHIYDRMQEVKTRVLEQETRPLFGVQNVGEGALWLDFGSVYSYYKNMISLLDSESSVADTLAQVFSLDRRQHYDSENNNILINCDVKELEAKDSVLINIRGEKVQVEKTVLVDSKVNIFVGNHSLAYSVEDEGVLILGPGEVRADVPLESSKVAIYSKIEQDNKHVWDQTLPKNPFSFEELYQRQAK